MGKCSSKEKRGKKLVSADKGNKEAEASASASPSSSPPTSRAPASATTTSTKATPRRTVEATQAVPTPTVSSAKLKEAKKSHTRPAAVSTKVEDSNEATTSQSFEEPEMFCGEEIQTMTSAPVPAGPQRQKGAIKKEENQSDNHPPDVRLEDFHDAIDDLPDFPALDSSFDESEFRTPVGRLSTDSSYSSDKSSSFSDREMAVTSHFGFSPKTKESLTTKQGVISTQQFEVLRSNREEKPRDGQLAKAKSNKETFQMRLLSATESQASNQETTAGQIGMVLPIHTREEHFAAPREPPKLVSCDNVVIQAKPPPTEAGKLSSLLQDTEEHPGETPIDMGAVSPFESFEHIEASDAYFSEEDMQPRKSDSSYVMLGSEKTETATGDSSPCSLEAEQSEGIADHLGTSQPIKEEPFKQIEAAHKHITASDMTTVEETEQTEIIMPKSLPPATKAAYAEEEQDNKMPNMVIDEHKKNEPREDTIKDHRQAVKFIDVAQRSQQAQDVGSRAVNEEKQAAKDEVNEVDDKHELESTAPKEYFGEITKLRKMEVFKDSEIAEKMQPQGSELLGVVEALPDEAVQQPEHPTLQEDAEKKHVVCQESASAVKTKPCGEGDDQDSEKEAAENIHNVPGSQQKDVVKEVAVATQREHFQKINHEKLTKAGEVHDVEQEPQQLTLDLGQASTPLECTEEIQPACKEQPVTSIHVQTKEILRPIPVDEIPIEHIKKEDGPDSAILLQSRRQTPATGDEFIKRRQPDQEIHQEEFSLTPEEHQSHDIDERRKREVAGLDIAPEEDKKLHVIGVETSQIDSKPCRDGGQELHDYRKSSDHYASTTDATVFYAHKKDPLEPQVEEIGLESGQKMGITEETQAPKEQPTTHIEGQKEGTPEMPILDEQKKEESQKSFLEPKETDHSSQEKVVEDKIGDSFLKEDHQIHDLLVEHDKKVGLSADTVISEHQDDLDPEVRIVEKELEQESLPISGESHLADEELSATCKEEAAAKGNNASKENSDQETVLHGITERLEVFEGDISAMENDSAEKLEEENNLARQPDEISVLSQPTVVEKKEDLLEFQVQETDEHEEDLQEHHVRDLKEIPNQESRQEESFLTPQERDPAKQEGSMTIEVDPKEKTAEPVKGYDKTDPSEGESTPAGPQGKVSLLGVTVTNKHEEDLQKPQVTQLDERPNQGSRQEESYLMSEEMDPAKQGEGMSTEVDLHKKTEEPGQGFDMTNTLAGESTAAELLSPRGPVGTQEPCAQAKHSELTELQGRTLAGRSYEEAAKTILPFTVVQAIQDSKETSKEAKSSDVQATEDTDTAVEPSRDASEDRNEKASPCIDGSVNRPSSEPAEVDSPIDSIEQREMPHFSKVLVPDTEAKVEPITKESFTVGVPDQIEESCTQEKHDNLQEEQTDLAKEMQEESLSPIGQVDIEEPHTKEKHLESDVQAEQGQNSLEQESLQAAGETMLSISDDQEIVDNKNSEEVKACDIQEYERTDMAEEPTSEKDAPSSDEHKLDGLEHRMVENTALEGILAEQDILESTKEPHNIPAEGQCSTKPKDEKKPSIESEEADALIDNEDYCEMPAASKEVVPNAEAEVEATSIESLTVRVPVHNQEPYAQEEGEKIQKEQGHLEAELQKNLLTPRELVDTEEPCAQEKHSGNVQVKMGENALQEESWEAAVETVLPFPDNKAIMENKETSDEVRECSVQEHGSKDMAVEPTHTIEVAGEIDGASTDEYRHDALELQIEEKPAQESILAEKAVVEFNVEPQDIPAEGQRSPKPEDINPASIEPEEPKPLIKSEVHCKVPNVSKEVGPDAEEEVEAITTESFDVGMPVHNQDPCAQEEHDSVFKKQGDLAGELQTESLAPRRPLGNEEPTAQETHSERGVQVDLGKNALKGESLEAAGDTMVPVTADQVIVGNKQISEDIKVCDVQEHENTDRAVELRVAGHETSENNAPSSDEHKHDALESVLEDMPAQEDIIAEKEVEGLAIEPQDIPVEGQCSLNSMDTESPRIESEEAEPPIDSAEHCEVASISKQVVPDVETELEVISTESLNKELRVHNQKPCAQEDHDNVQKQQEETGLLTSRGPIDIAEPCLEENHSQGDKQEELEENTLQGVSLDAPVTDDQAIVDNKKTSEEVKACIVQERELTDTGVERRDAAEEIGEKDAPRGGNHKNDALKLTTEEKAAQESITAEEELLEVTGEPQDIPAEERYSPKPEKGSSIEPEEPKPLMDGEDHCEVPGVSEGMVPDSEAKVQAITTQSLMCSVGVPVHIPGSCAQEEHDSVQKEPGELEAKLQTELFTPSGIVDNEAPCAEEKHSEGTAQAELGGNALEGESLEAAGETVLPVTDDQAIVNNKETSEEVKACDIQEHENTEITVEPRDAGHETTEKDTCDEHKHDDLEAKPDEKPAQENILKEMLELTTEPQGIPTQGQCSPKSEDTKRPSLKPKEEEPLIDSVEHSEVPGISKEEVLAAADIEAITTESLTVGEPVHIQEPCAHEEHDHVQIQQGDLTGELQTESSSPRGPIGNEEPCADVKAELRENGLAGATSEAAGEILPPFADGQAAVDSKKTSEEVQTCDVKENQSPGMTVVSRDASEKDAACSYEHSIDSLELGTKEKPAQESILNEKEVQHFTKEPQDVPAEGQRCLTTEDTNKPSIKPEEAEPLIDSEKDSEVPDIPEEVVPHAEADITIGVPVHIQEPCGQEEHDCVRQEQGHLAAEMQTESLTRRELVGNEEPHAQEKHSKGDVLAGENALEGESLEAAGEIMLPFTNGQAIVDNNVKNDVKACDLHENDSTDMAIEPREDAGEETSEKDVPCSDELNHGVLEFEIEENPGLDSAITEKEVLEIAIEPQDIPVEGQCSPTSKETKKRSIEPEETEPLIDSEKHSEVPDTSEKVVPKADAEIETITTESSTPLHIQEPYTQEEDDNHQKEQGELAHEKHSEGHVQAELEEKASVGESLEATGKTGLPYQEIVGNKETSEEVKASDDQKIESSGMSIQPSEEVAPCTDANKHDHLELRMEQKSAQQSFSAEKKVLEVTIGPQDIVGEGECSTKPQDAQKPSIEPEEAEPLIDSGELCVIPGVLNEIVSDAAADVEAKTTESSTIGVPIHIQKPCVQVEHDNVQKGQEDLAVELHTEPLVDIEEPCDQEKHPEGNVQVELRGNASEGESAAGETMLLLTDEQVFVDNKETSEEANAFDKQKNESTDVAVEPRDSEKDAPCSNDHKHGALELEKQAQDSMIAEKEVLKLTIVPQDVSSQEQCSPNSEEAKWPSMEPEEAEALIDSEEHCKLPGISKEVALETKAEGVNLWKVEEGVAATPKQKGFEGESILGAGEAIQLPNVDQALMINENRIEEVTPDDAGEDEITSTEGGTPENFHEKPNAIATARIDDNDDGLAQTVGQTELDQETFCKQDRVLEVAQEPLDTACLKESTLPADDRKTPYIPPVKTEITEPTTQEQELIHSEEQGGKPDVAKTENVDAETAPETIITESMTQDEPLDIKKPTAQEENREVQKPKVDVLQEQAVEGKLFQTAEMFIQPSSAKQASMEVKEASDEAELSEILEIDSLSLVVEPPPGTIKDPSEQGAKTTCIDDYKLDLPEPGVAEPPDYKVLEVAIEPQETAREADSGLTIKDSKNPDQQPAETDSHEIGVEDVEEECDEHDISKTESTDAAAGVKVKITESMTPGMPTANEEPYAQDKGGDVRKAEEVAAAEYGLTTQDTKKPDKQPVDTAPQDIDTEGVGESGKHDVPKRESAEAPPDEESISTELLIPRVPTDIEESFAQEGDGKVEEAEEAELLKKAFEVEITPAGDKAMQLYTDGNQESMDRNKTSEEAQADDVQMKELTDTGLEPPKNLNEGSNQFDTTCDTKALPETQGARTQETNNKEKVPEVATGTQDVSCQREPSMAAENIKRPNIQLDKEDPEEFLIQKQDKDFRNQSSIEAHAWDAATEGQPTMTQLLTQGLSTVPAMPHVKGEDRKDQGEEVDIPAALLFTQRNSIQLAQSDMYPPVPFEEESKCSIEPKYALSEPQVAKQPELECVSDENGMLKVPTKSPETASGAESTLAEDGKEPDIQQTREKSAEQLIQEETDAMTESLTSVVIVENALPCEDEKGDNELDVAIKPKDTAIPEESSHVAEDIENPSTQHTEADPAKLLIQEQLTHTKEHDDISDSPKIEAADVTTTEKGGKLPESLTPGAPECIGDPCVDHNQKAKDHVPPELQGEAFEGGSIPALKNSMQPIDGQVIVGSKATFEGEVTCTAVEDDVAAELQEQNFECESIPAAAMVLQASVADQAIVGGHETSKNIKTDDIQVNQVTDIAVEPAKALCEEPDISLATCIDDNEKDIPETHLVKDPDERGVYQGKELQVAKELQETACGEEKSALPAEDVQTPNIQPAEGEHTEPFIQAQESIDGEDHCSMPHVPKTKVPDAATQAEETTELMVPVEARVPCAPEYKDDVQGIQVNVQPELQGDALKGDSKQTFMITQPSSEERELLHLNETADKVKGDIEENKFTDFALESPKDKGEEPNEKNALCLDEHKHDPLESQVEEQPDKESVSQEQEMHKVAIERQDIALEEKPCSAPEVIKILDTQKDDAESAKISITKEQVTKEDQKTVVSSIDESPITGIDDNKDDLVAREQDHKGSAPEKVLEVTPHSLSTPWERDSALIAEETTRPEIPPSEAEQQCNMPKFSEMNVPDTTTGVQVIRTRSIIQELPLGNEETCAKTDNKDFQETQIINPEELQEKANEGESMKTVEMCMQPSTLECAFVDTQETCQEGKVAEAITTEPLTAEVLVPTEEHCTQEEDYAEVTEENVAELQVNGIEKEYVPSAELATQPSNNYGASTDSKDTSEEVKTNAVQLKEATHLEEDSHRDSCEDTDDNKDGLSESQVAEQQGDYQEMAVSREPHDTACEGYSSLVAADVRNSDFQSAEKEPTEPFIQKEELLSSEKPCKESDIPRLETLDVATGDKALTTEPLNREVPSNTESPCPQIEDSDVPKGHIALPVLHEEPVEGESTQTDEIGMQPSTEARLLLDIKEPSAVVKACDLKEQVTSLKVEPAVAGEEPREKVTDVTYIDVEEIGMKEEDTKEDFAFTQMNLVESAGEQKHDGYEIETINTALHDFQKVSKPQESADEQKHDGYELETKNTALHDFQKVSKPEESNQDQLAQINEMAKPGLRERNIAEGVSIAEGDLTNEMRGNTETSNPQQKDGVQEQDRLTMQEKQTMREEQGHPRPRPLEDAMKQELVPEKKKAPVSTHTEGADE